jgi:protein-S-isoprenylcysteine O-methyltransferase Ste14
MSKTRSAWWKNRRGEWYVVLQTLLFALVALGPGGVDSQPDLPAPARLACVLLGLGLGLIGLALALALAGLFGLGHNLSVFPHPKEGASLVQTGAYGMVRHPIYSGLIIGAVGWALLNVSLLTLAYAAIPFLFFDRKSRREERWLARSFPEYSAYQGRVRKLIPFVY